jgi:endo-1,4-beta-D-glucanase Y
MIAQGNRDGFWYTYNNSAQMQGQTPAKAPDLMPDTIAAEPTTPCSMNAFHSSATGQDMYVGFGATFKPKRPFESPPSQLKGAYDVSAWDGITFRAKTGGGPTTQPMYVEILAKESQPSTSGGTATTDTIDLYNTRGQIVTVSSTSYTQFFVPFGTLIPRWLPAVGSGKVCPAAGGSVPKCQAAKFVPANALGIQFSFYNDPGFPKPSPAGSYNMLIDDVAFYKRSALSGTSDLPALPASPGAMHPFPSNATLGSCTKPTGADGKLLATAYKNWKDNFVRAEAGGYRVVRPAAETGSGEDTVSEGIGYGMLISVYMNDKTLFDGFWTYWKAHCASGSGSSCLMTWRIGGAGGSGSATDADEDVAFALLMASKQWGGGTYMSDATGMMAAIMSAEMGTSAPYVWGGNNYKSGNMTINNPSYYAPAFYRAFATASGNAAWTTIANGVYNQISAANAISSQGLISAWCNQGCTAAASNGAATDTIYQYDSHRIPWRIGLDYCWNGTAAAKTYLDKVSGFFAGKGANGVGRIYDLYNPNGMEASGAAVNSASIIGTAAAGAMSGSNTAFVNDGYQLVLDLLNRGTLNNLNDGTKTAYSYFNATVGMLMLLTMSGNFINF